MLSEAVPGTKPFAGRDSKEAQGCLEIPRTCFRRYVFHWSQIPVRSIVLNGGLPPRIYQHGTRPEKSRVV